MNRVNTELKINYFDILFWVFILGTNLFIQYNFDLNVYLQTCLWSGTLYLVGQIKLCETKKVYNKGNVGLIITDPGEEIDDEIALYHLIKQTKDQIQKFSKIFIIFANGEANAKMTSKDRMEHFMKIFPEFDSNEVKIGSTDFVLLTTDCLKYINGNHFDVFLQIAPLCRIDPNFFKQNSFDTRIIMGDFNEPENSLNLKKSWKNNTQLDEEFEQQEEYLKLCNVKYITTGLARNVPLTFDNISRLPDDFQDIILDKAFKLFVGRVPYSSPHCMNVTVNANVKTITNYLGIDPEETIKNYLEIIGPEKEQTIDDFCDQFVEKMVSCDDKNQMKNALKVITCCVQIITKSDYKDSDFKFESLDNLEQAKCNFIDHLKYNRCDTTPAYDLTAMLLFMRPDINGKRFDTNSACFFKYRLMDY